MVVCFTLFGLVFCGCTKTVYETRYELKEVPVPIRIDVPNVECMFNGSTETDILNNYIECVVKQKKVLDMLRGEYKNIQ